MQKKGKKVLTTEKDKKSREKSKMFKKNHVKQCSRMSTVNCLKATLQLSNRRKKDKTMEGVSVSFVI